MLYKVISYVIVSSFYFLPALGQTINWTEQIASSGSDYISDIVTDKEGNIYVCGTFEKTLTIGSNFLISAGHYDVFIAKYTSTGSLLWANQAGGSEADMAKAMVLDSMGNLIVGGYFEGNATFGSNTIASSGSRDIFITKYDTNGALQWIKHAGGTEIDELSSLTIDKENNIYACGIFNGTASFDTTSSVSLGLDDIYIVSYSSDGSLRWLNQAGGSQNDFATAIATDYNNNVYISGYFNDSLIINQDTLLSVGATDALVTKYDSQGNLSWAKNLGGNNYDYASTLTTSPNGNIYLAGYFYSFAFPIGGDTLWNAGLSDIFIALYDTNGNFQWAQKAASTDQEYPFDLTSDMQGNAYLTGAIKDSLVLFHATTELQGAGGYDAFAAKYTEQGSVVWAESFGGSFYEYGYAITIDTAENLYIGGTFENSMLLGNDTLYCSGLTDIFISHYTNSISTIHYSPFVNIAAVKVYPNPFDEAFFLSVEGFENNCNVSIYNNLGQSIYTHYFAAGLENEKQIYLGDQPQGVYITQVTSNTKQLTFKLIRK